MLPCFFFIGKERFALKSISLGNVIFYRYKILKDFIIHYDRIDATSKSGEIQLLNVLYDDGKGEGRLV